MESVSENKIERQRELAKKAGGFVLMLCLNQCAMPGKNRLNLEHINVKGIKRKKANK